MTIAIDGAFPLTEYSGVSVDKVLVYLDSPWTAAKIQNPDGSWTPSYTPATIANIRAAGKIIEAIYVPDQSATALNTLSQDLSYIASGLSFLELPADTFVWYDCEYNPTPWNYVQRFVTLAQNRPNTGLYASVSWGPQLTGVITQYKVWLAHFLTTGGSFPEAPNTVTPPEVPDGAAGLQFWNDCALSGGLVDVSVFIDSAGAIPAPQPVAPAPAEPLGGTVSIDSVYSNLPDLSIGSTGPEVKVAQNLLNFYGHIIAIDGIFGRITDGAVRNFQESRNIEVDGVVGPETRDEFMKG